MCAQAKILGRCLLESREQRLSVWCRDRTMDVCHRGVQMFFTGRLHTSTRSTRLSTTVIWGALDLCTANACPGRTVQENGHPIFCMHTCLC